MPSGTAKSSEPASHYSYQQSPRDARHGNHKATPLPTPPPSEVHLLTSVHLRTLRGRCDLAPWKPTGDASLCLHVCTYDAGCTGPPDRNTTSSGVRKTRAPEDPTHPLLPGSDAQATHLLCLESGDKLTATSLEQGGHRFLPGHPMLLFSR